MKHKIEWTNVPGYKGATWNPIVGCSHASPGCDNCYAEIMAGRLANMGQEQYQKVVKINRSLSPNPTNAAMFSRKWNGTTHFVESQLEKPLKWKKPRAIFVCSMGDLFHETVPFEWIDKMFDVINVTPQHLYIILTKRPEKMWDYFRKEAQEVKDAGLDSVPTRSDNLWDYWSGYPNVWIGTTCEDHTNWMRRLHFLLDIPAAKHFVSVEPMIDIIDELYIADEIGDIYHALTGEYIRMPGYEGPVNYYKHKLDWVICGGESGSNARPMHVDWVRSIRDQCHESDTPFFFKQGSANNWYNFKDAKLDGKYHKEFPIWK